MSGWLTVRSPECSSLKLPRVRVRVVADADAELDRSLKRMYSVSLL